jgi:hypothetical protein
VGNFPWRLASGAWRLIGRATAGAASLPRKMAQKRARGKKIWAHGIFARQLEDRAGSPGRQTGS